MKNILLISILLFAFSNCNQSPAVDQIAEGEKLMELSRQWAKSQSNEEYLKYWAEDALLKGAGQPALKGKAEISKMLNENAQIPGFEVNWEPLEAFVSKSGDLGYLIENQMFGMNDSLGNKMKYYNKVVTIWHKQEDGTWINVIDIASSDPTMTSLK